MDYTFDSLLLLVVLATAVFAGTLLNDGFFHRKVEERERKIEQ